MGFNSRIYHYGFVLGMPAFLSMVFLLIWLLPEMLHRLCGRAGLFRFVAAVYLLTGLWRLAETSYDFYQKKNFAVGPATDRILAVDPSSVPENEMIAASLEWIGQNIAPHQTVATIPEGTLLNYLSRRSNSTPYLAFGAEVQAYGDRAMLAAYQHSPPDFIILVHGESGEYGSRFFGQEEGFGLGMMRWLETSYHSVHLIGHEPLQTNAFGIKILQRNSTGF